ncbi:MAG: hypothetical protein JSR96_00820 [Proteobacteria bacterium]|nr:hypothetical protein [Pseudomonadota bacterium]
MSLPKAARYLLPVLALAGCSQSQADPQDDGEPVYCSFAGQNDFKPDCRLERTVIDGAQVLVVRHPDGAFRRLQISKDGGHLEAADGADHSQSALKGDRYEVIIGGDRYVIPAKAGAAGADAKAR